MAYSVIDMLTEHLMADHNQTRRESAEAPALEHEKTGDLDQSDSSQLTNGPVEPQISAPDVGPPVGRGPMFFAWRHICGFCFFFGSGLLASVAYLDPGADLGHHSQPRGC